MGSEMCIRDRCWVCLVVCGRPGPNGAGGRSGTHVQTGTGAWISGGGGGGQGEGGENGGDLTLVGAGVNARLVGGRGGRGGPGGPGGGGSAGGRGGNSNNGITNGSGGGSRGSGGSGRDDGGGGSNGSVGDAGAEWINQRFPVRAGETITIVVPSRGQGGNPGGGGRGARRFSTFPPASNGTGGFSGTRDGNLQIVTSRGGDVPITPIPDPDAPDDTFTLTSVTQTFYFDATAGFVSGRGGSISDASLTLPNGNTVNINALISLTGTTIRLGLPIGTATAQFPTRIVLKRAGAEATFSNPTLTSNGNIYRSFGSFRDYTRSAGVTSALSLIAARETTTVELWYDE